MTDIALELIRPNPFRDFDLHPIDEAHVGRLAASIEQLGFLPGPSGRPTVDGHFELAFGHHRIEAARRLRLAGVPLLVDDLSDCQMALRMSAENAVHRGTTAAASLDAIAGLCRLVTETCLRCETPEEMGKILPISLHAAQTVWGRVRHGGFPGRDCILAIVPAGSYSEAQVSLALGVLRDSGRLGDAAPVLDARCARLFRRDYHLSTFRQFATGDTVRSYLPVDQQLAFATHVMEHLNALHHVQEITAEMIRTACWDRMESALGIPKARLRNAPDRPTLDLVKEGLNRLRRARSDFGKGVTLLLEAAEAGEELGDKQVKQLGRLIDSFADGLRRLETHKKPRLRVVGKEEAG